ncbi:MAG: hypothetical protein WCA46_13090 [Actinocatenispora sp.]
MTVWEVLLVFVGVPLGVFLLMAAAVYGTASTRSRRYRPGRPFDFAPVWFLGSPEPVIGLTDVPAPAGQLTAGDGAQTRALEAAPAARTGSAHGAKGGASGSW